MGNWQLEVGKMAIYMAFPVATFYAYHQIDWFADQYKGMQRKLYTTEDQMAKVEFQEFLKGMKEFEEKKRKHELMRAESSVAKQMGDKTLTLEYSDS